MINYIELLSRKKKQIIFLFLDLVIIIAAIFLSFVIRFESLAFVDKHMFAIYIAPFVALPILYFFKVYKMVIRFASLSLIRYTFLAITSYIVIWSSIVFLFSSNMIPRSIPIINWLVTLTLIILSRLAANWILYKINYFKTTARRVIIYGGGDAGVQLASGLINSKEYYPVAIIDDSKQLQNTQINGIRVLKYKDIEKIIQKYSVIEIFVAIPSISNKERADLITKLQRFNLVVKTLPNLSELAGGKVRIDSLRQIQIDDLLGREAIQPNITLLSKNVKGKSILITGAGGSIGSEISRQVFKLKPRKIILFEHNELALYSIDKELGNQSIKVIPILGSVRDKERIRDVIRKFKINTIYHAAAYKHVPMVEYNVSEGISNNVFGTINVAKAAVEFNVDTFVLISTDKAVRPTSTMGVSKRIAELSIIAISKESRKNTLFSIVRFGNVLDSSGSVIPLFKKQIENGGPVTVTSKEITRFFMTIPEAVELVIQAGAMSKGTDIFVLDMGEPIFINELAKKMVNLSGLKVRDEKNPNGDIEIIYTGLRPGEKLYEELFVENVTSPTRHERILRSVEEGCDIANLNSKIEILDKSIKNHDYEKLRNTCSEIVKDYSPQCGIMDHIHCK